MTDILKRLGYGGSAVISDFGGGGPCQVIITSGSFEQSNSVSYMPMISTPPTASNASRVLHADGTAAYSGTVGFDVSVAAMSLFGTSKLLGRGYPFDVGIHDGEISYHMTDCRMTGVTLSGAPGGLVNASVSFMSKTGKSAAGVANVFIRDSTTPSGQMVGYWWSGGPDVKDWSLTVSQSVEAMYGNEDSVEPLYLRVGLIDYVLTANLYADNFAEQDKISICTSKFQLTGMLQAKGYAYAGVTELGTYSHTFETSALNDSNSTVIQSI